MIALYVLLGIALALLATGAVGRVAPGMVAAIRAVLCIGGLLAALAARGVAVLDLGLSFAVDGLSAAVLAALFLLGACGAAGPVVLGALALGVLSGDAAGLLLFLLAAVLAAPPATEAWAAARPGLVRAGAVLSIAAALLLLAWHAGLPDPRMAAIRAMPPAEVSLALAPLFTLAGAFLLAVLLPPAPGALAALYVIARLLLDLAGPTTPGWWGVPVLLLGMVASLAMARRAGAAEDLEAAGDSTGRAVIGLSAACLGVALLARGADLPPMAALAVLAALLHALCWAAWGGLLRLATVAVREAAGATTLLRLGGLLRLMPVTGLALLVALASMAVLPITPGFAGAWLALQALLGAARLGGTAVLALMAAAVAACGLATALLAAAAMRLAGLVLLGAPRTAKAASAPEAPPALRLAMAALTLALLVLGVLPWLGTVVAQPGVRLLTGVAADGAGPWTLATMPDAAGYAAPGLAVLMALAVGLVGWAARSTSQPVAPWRGGLAEDGPARSNTLPLILWPDWRQVQPAVGARTVLVALGLALAMALGWAVR